MRWRPRDGGRDHPEDNGLPSSIPAGIPAPLSSQLAQITASPAAATQNGATTLAIVSNNSQGTAVVIDGTSTFVGAGVGLPSAASTTDERKVATSSMTSSTSSAMSETSSSSGSVSSFGFATPPPASAVESPPAHHKSFPPIGALVIIPLLVVIGLIAGFFIWRRKRRQRLALGVGHSEEMKVRSPEEGQGLQQGPPTYTESPLLHTPIAANPSAVSFAPAATTSSSLSHTQTPSSPAESNAQPVILTNNIASNYLTGIDTSDAISLNSPNRQRTSIDGNSIMSDEPPPPYRPRSVPPISRETSLRNPAAAAQETRRSLAPLSEGNSSVQGDERTVSEFDPFEDPDDGDTVSSLSSPVAGQGEGRSPVSDIDPRDRRPRI